MTKQLFLIIGEVFVDTHLDIIESGSPLLRLGGIFHAARAFAALDLDYALAYCAPKYLDKDINEWALHLQAKRCYKLGNIDKSPNVMLVSESKEAGDQGYCGVLRSQAVYEELMAIEEIVAQVNPTDILIYPGCYEATSLISRLEKYSCRIHIDFHYDADDLKISSQQHVESIILSTSSHYYKHHCDSSLDGVINKFSQHKIGQFLIKENRGGAYCYCTKGNGVHESPAYFGKTKHSVGVGDVFNSLFIIQRSDLTIQQRMKFASLCASKYAATLSYQKFKKDVLTVYNSFNEMRELEGVRLPWEERAKINIYLAAPDFPEIDTQKLFQLKDALTYHNFCPRLPIQENGVVSKETSIIEELSIYQKDIILLNSCDMLIAVLLYNDPGTLVEFGMFKQLLKPTIIYDPFNYCKNMFVRHSADYLCKTVDEVIDATYLCMGRRI